MSLLFHGVNAQIIFLRRGGRFPPYFYFWLFYTGEIYCQAIINMISWRCMLLSVCNKCSFDDTRRAITFALHRRRGDRGISPFSISLATSKYCSVKFDLFTWSWWFYLFNGFQFLINVITEILPGLSDLIDLIDKLPRLYFYIYVFWVQHFNYICQKKQDNPQGENNVAA